MQSTPWTEGEMACRGHRCESARNPSRCRSRHNRQASEHLGSCYSGDSSKPGFIGWISVFRGRQVQIGEDRERMKWIRQQKDRNISRAVEFPEISGFSQLMQTISSLWKKRLGSIIYTRGTQWRGRASGRDCLMSGLARFLASLIVSDPSSGCLTKQNTCTGELIPINEKATAGSTGKCNYQTLRIYDVGTRQRIETQRLSFSHGKSMTFCFMWDKPRNEHTKTSQESCSFSLAQGFCWDNGDLEQWVHAAHNERPLPGNSVSKCSKFAHCRQQFDIATSRAVECFAKAFMHSLETCQLLCRSGKDCRYSLRNRVRSTNFSSRWCRGWASKEVDEIRDGRVFRDKMYITNNVLLVLNYRKPTVI